MCNRQLIKWNIGKRDRTFAEVLSASAMVWTSITVLASEQFSEIITVVAPTLNLPDRTSFFSI
jgi:hypothetical protein